MSITNKKILNMSPATLRRKIESASKGNQKIMNELIKHANDTAKLVNNRMRKMEKTGYDFQSAYDRAAYYLSTQPFSRFREKWNVTSAEKDWERFAIEIMETNNFIRNPLSTASEVKNSANARAEFILNNLDLDIADTKNPAEMFSNASPRKQAEIAKLLSYGSLSELLSGDYGITGEVLDVASAVINSAVTLENQQKRAGMYATLEKNARFVINTLQNSTLERQRILAELRKGL